MALKIRNAALRAWEKAIWFGRINILKMMILPKFMFLFQIPIRLPRVLFLKAQREFTKFVWHCKPPHVSYVLCVVQRQIKGWVSQTSRYITNPLHYPT